MQGKADGAILDETSIGRIRARIVAGGANNQLATAADGQRLLDAGVLYAPDYVINVGDIINVASEYFGDADDAGVLERVSAIGPRLYRIFEEAAASGRPTNVVADEQAREIIAALDKRGAWVTPGSMQARGPMVTPSPSRAWSETRAPGWIPPSGTGRSSNTWVVRAKLM